MVQKLIYFLKKCSLKTYLRFIDKPREIRSLCDCLQPAGNRLKLREFQPDSILCPWPSCASWLVMIMILEFFAYSFPSSLNSYYLCIWLFFPAWFFPALLRYDWYITPGRLYKFKVYNIMIWLCISYGMITIIQVS